MSDYQNQYDLIRKFYSELDVAAGSEHSKVIHKYVNEDYLWRGFHPFHEMYSGDEVIH